MKLETKKEKVVGVGLNEARVRDVVIFGDLFSIFSHSQHDKRFRQTAFRRGCFNTEQNFELGSNYSLIASKCSADVYGSRGGRTRQADRFDRLVESDGRRILYTGD